MTAVFPLFRNGAPRMLHPHVVPARRDGCGEADRSSGKEGQHGQPMHGWQGMQTTGRDRERRAGDGGGRVEPKNGGFYSAYSIWGRGSREVIGNIAKRLASLSIQFFP